MILLKIGWAFARIPILQLPPSTLTLRVDFASGEEGVEANAVMLWAVDRHAESLSEN